MIDTKYGCGADICGACIVLVNDKSVRSCETSLESLDGKDIETTEGLAHDGKLQPLQAFIDVAPTAVSGDGLLKSPA
ncbi:MAG TPA: 2Fe-2S iron-sulfur cluster-binding protein [Burkholderiaceae bacterium]